MLRGDRERDTDKGARKRVIENDEDNGERKRAVERVSKG